MAKSDDPRLKLVTFCTNVKGAHGQPQVLGLLKHNVKCDQNGLCCSMPDGNRCIHLDVNPGMKIGDPGATSCSRYIGRWPGMPVLVVSEDGGFRGRSTCAPGLFPNYCCAGRPECIK